MFRRAHYIALSQLPPTLPSTPWPLAVILQWLPKQQTKRLKLINCLFLRPLQRVMGSQIVPQWATKPVSTADLPCTLKSSFFKTTERTLFHLWLFSVVEIFLKLVHESFLQCIFLPLTYSTAQYRAPHCPALSAPQRSWAWANSFCLSSPPTHFEKRLRGHRWDPSKHSDFEK